MPTQSEIARAFTNARRLGKAKVSLPSISAQAVTELRRIIWKAEKDDRAYLNKEGISVACISLTLGEHYDELTRMAEEGCRSARTRAYVKAIEAATDMELTL